MGNAVTASANWRRAAILFAALALRFVLGYVFFGSVDLLNMIGITTSIFDGDGRLITSRPYFPTVSVFDWLAGYMNTATALPLAFCFKIAPIVFDSLLAVLVYDLAAARGTPKAFLLGMLYALCPVAVIVNSFHVQWDSILIYFLALALFVRGSFADSPGKYVLFGMVFCLSILIKPVAAVFLPLLLVRADTAKTFLTYNSCTAAGLASTFLIYLGVLWLMGFDIAAMFEHILGYAHTGVIITGLPFAYPFSEFDFMKTRLWITGPILYVAYFYYLGKISFTDSVVLVFALTLGLAGISTQYQLWLIPFLLVTGRTSWTALYGLAASIFMMFYYMNPLAPYFPGENMGTFAALKPFAWAMPPAYLTAEWTLPLIKGLGNYAIPCISLAIAVSVIRANWRGLCEPPAPGGEGGVFWRLYAPASAAVFLAVLVLYLAADPAALYGSFSAVLEDKLGDYAMTVGKGRALGDYGGSSAFNIFYLGVLAAAAWSFAAWRAR